MRSLKEFFRRNRRQKITLLSALVIVYAASAAGIFSYFQSKDAVTNSLQAEAGSVSLTETEWDKTGQQKAAASVPGMNIPKNPCAVNDGEIDLYIRLKMTVELDDASAATNEQRCRGILNAVMRGDVQFFTNTAGELHTWGCSSPDYVWEEDGQLLDSGKLVFYFYYTAGDKVGEGESAQDVMHVVRPGESTAELFTSLQLPVLRSEYLGIFDREYDIALQAEAVPAGKYDTVPDIDTVRADF